MKVSKAQIIATIGPASSNLETFSEMIKHGVDVVRLNFSWGDLETRVRQFKSIREIEKKFGRKIPIIQDLPGPRVQIKNGHTYNHDSVSSITDQDKEFIKFGIENGADYVALSFVRGPEDIRLCRGIIQEYSGTQRIIAKIECATALESLDDILAISDAVMIARGDLGNEIPLEQIPFVQANIIEKSKKIYKPVITATQMLLSMVENLEPTRAEVTDVTNAILQGSDAVMLSEETAKGKYPVETVIMMEKIIMEAEKHMNKQIHINSL